MTGATSCRLCACVTRVTVLTCCVNEGAAILKHPKLIGWYGQNVEQNEGKRHPKLHHLPLGHHNRQWADNTPTTKRLFQVRPPGLVAHAFTGLALQAWSRYRHVATRDKWAYMNFNPGSLHAPAIRRPLWKKYNQKVAWRVPCPVAREDASLGNGCLIPWYHGRTGSLQSA